MIVEDRSYNAAAWGQPWGQGAKALANSHYRRGDVDSVRAPNQDGAVGARNASGTAAKSGGRQVEGSRTPPIPRSSRPALE